ncbi:hypothetical protein K501DRAFT_282039, partial [Backusella circina FSU 941]
MTDLLHQYTPSEYYQSEYSYHQLTLQTEKVQRRPSFSTLLQKRPSLMGRKLSLFGPKNKKKLNVIIPSSSLLSRKVSDSSTGSESTYNDDMPTTPPPLDMSHSTSYSSDNTVVDLEQALTTPSLDAGPMMDYSGKKYSNFYMRLPNGNWMVRIRDENRKIIGTYEIDGSM